MYLNEVKLIGNVGQNPEIKTLDNGHKVCQFSVATTKKGYTTRDSKVIPDRTEWHSIIAWDTLCNYVEKAVKKGTPVFVCGELRTRKYEDSSGITRYATEVYAIDIQQLGGSASTRPPMPTSPDEAPNEAQAAAPAAAAPSAAGAPMMDDMPF